MNTFKIKTKEPLDIETITTKQKQNKQTYGLTELFLKSLLRLKKNKEGKKKQVLFQYA